jgi:hypothetical protein
MVENIIFEGQETGGPLLCKVYINRETNLIKNVCSNIQSLKSICNENDTHLWIHLNTCKSCWWGCKDGHMLTVVTISSP